MRISDWSSDVCSSDLGERGLLAPEGERHHAAGDGAHGELSLGADVPHVGAKADGEADPDQDERRTLHHELAPAVEAGERRSEEHTSELQSLMRISYAVFCLKKNNITSNA